MRWQSGSCAGQGRVVCRSSRGLAGNEHGGFGGRLTSLACTDASARHAPYRAADDERASRALARGFVDGKIANMRISLLRAGRRVPDPVVTGAAGALAITRLILDDAAPMTRSSVMRGAHRVSQGLAGDYRGLLGIHCP